MASILNTCLTRQKPIDGDGMYGRQSAPSPNRTSDFDLGRASQARVGGLYLRNATVTID
jgi:hypothetical protein